MAKRRHRSVFDNPHTPMAACPAGEARKAEFRPPAELARKRGKANLEHATRAGLRPDVIDEHDLAARPYYARELIERSLGIGHCRNDKLRHHHVE